MKPFLAQLFSCLGRVGASLFMLGAFWGLSSASWAQEAPIVFRRHIVTQEQGGEAHLALWEPGNRIEIILNSRKHVGIVPNPLPEEEFTSPASITWLYSAGGAAPTFSSINIELRPNCVFARTSDLDGDGDIDILGAFEVSYNVLFWYENNGGAPPSFTKHYIANDRHYYAINMFDFEGDGDDDFVAKQKLISPFIEEYVLYTNDGNGFFTQRRVNPMSLQPARRLDLDGDSDLDIHQGENIFIAEDISRFLYRKAPVRATALADLNGDGYLDFLWGNEWTENPGPNLLCNCLATRAIYGFSTAEIPVGSFGTPDQEPIITVGDLNADGSTDILSVQRNICYLNDNLIPPSFSPRAVELDLPFDLDGGNTNDFETLYTLDYDGDGDLDFIVSTSADIFLYENLTRQLASGASSSGIAAR
jgi:hypothetical protein